MAIGSLKFSNPCALLGLTPISILPGVDYVQKMEKKGMTG
jgi:hypothetical protein